VLLDRVPFHGLASRLVGVPLEQFGRYVLSERIAAGGMAEIWRGALLGPAGFSRPLAIKRILPNHTADADFIRMFVDEARIASSLSHPNVVSVTDFGEQGGHYYLAMEYVAGRHLGNVIGASLRQKQVLPVPFGVMVIRDALHGLAHAHEKLGSNGQALQIVHRDISPQNIMVGFDGAARVADFGIATALGRMTQTDSGAIKGKYAYMSPEQARGEGVDARSDIYAMGVVLWETLAVHRLHGPELDHMQVLHRVMAGEVRLLSDVVNGMPQALVDIVHMALAPAKEARFQNAQAFARALSGQLAVLAPGWSAPDTAKVMRQLFEKDMLEEQTSLAKLESLARKMSRAQMPAFSGTGAQGQAKLSGAGPAAPQPPTGAEISMGMEVTHVPLGPLLPGPAPARSTNRRWIAAGALTTLGVGAALLWGMPGPAVVPVAPAAVMAAQPTTAVIVESVPGGATVRINGELKGTTPLRLALPTGTTALLTAHLDGRQDAQQTVNVNGQQMVVLVELPSR